MLASWWRVVIMSDGRASPDSSEPSSKRSRMDSLSEDVQGRSGAGAPSGGGGAGSTELGNASGNWIGGAQFGSHGVTTRMSRNFSLPIYDNGNYRRINGASSSVLAVDKWSGYSTPWGYIDFNRWDLHFSPRAWQKLLNNYRGIRPKKMQVRICNLQVREAIYNGTTTIYNSSPNGSIMAVVDYDGKYPYVLGNMQWGHLSVAPYKVAQLPQYGYTFSGCGDSTGFYCLEGGNCQVLRTGDTVTVSYEFRDAPMLDLCIVAQQANQTANPLLGSYMLRSWGLATNNVTNVTDARFIGAGNFSIMYQNFLFGNLWQHSLFNNSSASRDSSSSSKASTQYPVDSSEVDFPVGDVIIGDPRSGDGNEVLKDGQPIEGNVVTGENVNLNEFSTSWEGNFAGCGRPHNNYTFSYPVKNISCVTDAFRDNADLHFKAKEGVDICINKISSGSGKAFIGVPGVPKKQWPDTHGPAIPPCETRPCPTSDALTDETQPRLTRQTRNGGGINTTAYDSNTTWYKSVSYTSLKNGTDSNQTATFDTVFDGPHGQSWVESPNGIAGHPMIAQSYKEGTTLTWKQTPNALTDEDWNVSCNPLAGAQSGTSVTQTSGDVLKSRAVNVRGIFPGTCWQDKDIWYSGPIWCKIPDISSFHPKPLFGGYGLKHPPPQIFLKNNPIYVPLETSTSGLDYITNSYVNQLSSGQVSVEIEWECIPDQGVAWGPEDTQTAENFGGHDTYCPDTNAFFTIGSNTSSRTLRKHI
nr:capsid protein [Canary dependoparvovirus 2]